MNAKKYGMHFHATQVLSSLDSGSNLPPFSLIDIKMCRYIRRYSFGTGHFRLFVPTESILIPTGSLYTHRSQIVPPESKRHAHRDKDGIMTILVFQSSLQDDCIPTGIILGMCSANERQRYILTSSLIGWTHAQYDHGPRFVMQMNLLVGMRHVSMLRA